MKLGHAQLAQSFIGSVNGPVVGLEAGYGRTGLFLCPETSLIKYKEGGKTMPDIKFNCTHCQQSLEAPADMAGEQVECPSCQQVMLLPAHTESSAPPKKKIVIRKAGSSDSSRHRNVPKQNTSRHQRHKPTGNQRSPVPTIIVAVLITLATTIPIAVYVVKKTAPPRTMGTPQREEKSLSRSDESVTVSVSVSLNDGRFISPRTEVIIVVQDSQLSGVLARLTGAAATLCRAQAELAYAKQKMDNYGYTGGDLGAMGEEWRQKISEVADTRRKILDYEEQISAYSPTIHHTDANGKCVIQGVKANKTYILFGKASFLRQEAYWLVVINKTSDPANVLLDNENAIPVGAL